MLPSVRLSRVYLIEGEGLTLVDSGLPWSGGGALAYIESIGRRARDLRTILVTHGHPDHTGAAGALSKATGAAIVAHRADTVATSDGRRALAYRGTLGMVRSPLPLRGPAVARRLVEDGDVLPIHGGIRAIHTPGHTPGSLCFLMEESGILFSGDTIFSDGERISRSVPFPGYSRASYVRSLKRLAEMEFEAVCGGHGEPLRSGGSGAVRNLLRTRPDPPTWGGFFRGLPRRLSRSRSRPLTGEYE